MSDVRRFAALALLVVCAGCAANPAPPLPAVPAYPDFMYPAVPGAAGSGPSESIERGWRFLQNDNLQAADREFSAALGRAGFYPARTGIGYVALARKDFAAATEAFGSALKAASSVFHSINTTPSCSVYRCVTIPHRPSGGSLISSTSRYPPPFP